MALLITNLMSFLNSKPKLYFIKPFFVQKNQLCKVWIYIPYHEINKEEGNTYCIRNSIIAFSVLLLYEHVLTLASFWTFNHKIYS